MNNSTNFNLILPDGEVTGRIKCILANRMGLAYKTSRAYLYKCKDRQDLKQSGVYIPKRLCHKKYKARLKVVKLKLMRLNWDVFGNVGRHIVGVNKPSIRMPFGIFLGMVIGMNYKKKSN